MYSTIAMVLIIAITADEGTCFSRYAVRHSQIIGERRIKPYEGSHYVVLFDEDEFFYCSGTMLTTQHVLTAKHCVLNWDMSIIVKYIVAGDILSQENKRKVEKVHMSPKPVNMVFNSELTNRTNEDIAIIKVDKPFVLSRDIRTVKLPTEPTKMFEKVSVFGLGATDYDDEHEVIHVQTFDIQIINCKIESVSLDEICTDNHYKAFCHADSGTGLINQKDEVVGIASRNVECGRTGLQDIYINVYFHLGFIKSVLNIEQNVN